jgi:type I restriction enzyme R subunit
MKALSLPLADLSERDICSKYISPAVERAGWDMMHEVREEVSFAKGRIIVRGKLVSRGRAKRAYFILYFKPNILTQPPAPAPQRLRVSTSTH